MTHLRPIKHPELTRLQDSQSVMDTSGINDL